MKTKIKKDFDAVKYMRQKRDEISRDISDMNYSEIKEYFSNRLKNKKERIRPSR